MRIHKWTTAALPIVIAIGWTFPAHADEVVVQSPPPPPPAPVVVAPAQQSETVTEKSGPSGGLLASGVVTFGLTYGAAVIVAGSSSLDADHRMFVPIAGPWMALFNRGPCGGLTGPSCDADTTNKVLIVADGIGQALGAFMIVDAFLNPATTTVSRTTTTAAARPTVRVAPSSMGAGGYGMLAVGSF